MSLTPRVLFVDDEPSIRETLTRILGMHGFEVSTAATVFEASEKINERHFEVLISDLNIGHPGDGLWSSTQCGKSSPKATTSS